MSAGSLWGRLASLPLVVERCRLTRLTLPVRSGFERQSTVVHLEGAGQAGCGEDVTYESIDHETLHRQGSWPLAGSFTLESFSAHLDQLELFPEPPQAPASRDFRRWALESAALDLALRQAGRSLAAQLDRPLRPVQFVTSGGLGQPPSIARLAPVLERRPGCQLKLDASGQWDDRLVAELATLGSVRVVDFKGQYKGTPVDQAPDPDLYRRVARGLPHTWLEDPAWTDETAAVLQPFRHRVAWDAPLHSLQDLAELPFPPQVVNIKPSRFGRIRTLCAAYEHCMAEDVEMYGGGQFELGPGRGQIQLLASLFHPDGPNDVAPVAYHDPDNAAHLPASPLLPQEQGDEPGFHGNCFRIETM